MSKKRAERYKIATVHSVLVSPKVGDTSTLQAMAILYLPACFFFTCFYLYLHLDFNKSSTILTYFTMSPFIFMLVTVIMIESMLPMVSGYPVGDASLEPTD